MPSCEYIPIWTTSRTVTGKVGSRSLTWGTYPTDPRGARPGTAPLTRTRPALTLTMPSRARMRVVLPEPLGPTSARACPAGTCPETPVSTVEEP